MAKIVWQAEMKIAGVEAPAEPGAAPVLKLALRGGIDGETLASLAWMMKAPVVRVTLEQLQPSMFRVAGETGELSE